MDLIENLEKDKILRLIFLCLPLIALTGLDFSKILPRVEFLNDKDLIIMSENQCEGKKIISVNSC